MGKVNDCQAELAELAQLAHEPHTYLVLESMFESVGRTCRASMPVYSLEERLGGRLRGTIMGPNLEPFSIVQVGIGGHISTFQYYMYILMTSRRIKS